MFLRIATDHSQEEKRMIKKTVSFLLFLIGFASISLGSLFVFINRLGERSIDGHAQIKMGTIWTTLSVGIILLLVTVIIDNIKIRGKIRQKELQPTTIHYNLQRL